MALADEPYHGGMKFLKELGWKESQDSTLFRLLKEAGFIIIGKTKTPELGTMTTTEPLAYGRSENKFVTGVSGWSPCRGALKTLGIRRQGA